MSKTSIEWSDFSWNPVRGTKGRHHCVRISEGCKNCYAATMNHRFGGPDYVKGADVPRLDEEALLHPLKWKRARRIFVCSMTDLFMEEHGVNAIFNVFAIMARCPQHTFQVLTKRASRMRQVLSDLKPLPNVWLGVSAENQERADERIPDLLATPAAVRFVSAEPLLGPIRLDRPISTPDGSVWDAMARGALSWVIAGGESGPGARPCAVSWIRSIKDQCQAAEVPVFVKQLGAKPREHQKNGTGGWLALKDKKGGDPSEWPADLRVREMPNAR